MDAYEATKIVFQKIQTLDPQNASKIMGVLLIQDHGEKEMIRLAFGPESLVHSVIFKARKELNLVSSNMPLTPTSSSPSPFSHRFSLSTQNSTSSNLLLGANLPPPLSISKNSSNFTDFQAPDDYNNSTSPNSIYASGKVDLIDELHLQDQLSFLNDGSTQLGPKGPDFFYQQQAPYAASWGGSAAVNHRRSCSVSDICMGSDDLSGGFGWKPCLFYARGS